MRGLTLPTPSTPAVMGLNGDCKCCKGHSRGVLLQAHPSSSASSSHVPDVMALVCTQTASTAVACRAVCKAFPILTVRYCLQIAAALQAEKLILMTDVPGVLKDKDDVSTKYNELDIRSTRELVADGIIAGGMIPKYDVTMLGA